MEMTFLGTTSGGGSCPNVYGTDRGTLVFQGDKVTDPNALKIAHDRGLPEHETLVEIPVDLLQYVPRELLQAALENNRCLTA